MVVISIEKSSTQICLGGGFKEETKTLLVSSEEISPLLELESTQEEADTRLILHSIYEAQNGSQRVVIHTNDTDVIVMAIYYASTDKLSSLQELWICTEQNSYLPVHEITAALGPSLCYRLPFLHSLSGRDTTSYPYYTEKKA